MRNDVEVLSFGLSLFCCDLQTYIKTMRTLIFIIVFFPLVFFLNVVNYVYKDICYHKKFLIVLSGVLTF